MASAAPEDDRTVSALTTRVLRYLGKSVGAEPAADLDLYAIAEALGVSRRRAQTIFVVLESCKLLRRKSKTTFEWVGDARSQEQEALACSQNTVPELRQKDELLERNISRIKLGFPKSASPDYCLPLAELQSLSVMRDKTIITMAHGTELEISDPSVVFRLLLTAPAATPMDVHIVEPALANDDPERGAKRRKREDGGEDRVRPLLPAPSASSHVAGPRKTNCSQFFGKREIVMTVSPSDALCGEMATSQLSQMSHCDSQLEAGAAPAANGGGGAPLPDFPSQATPSSQTSSVTVNSALISQRDDDFSWSQTQ